MGSKSEKKSKKRKKDKKHKDKKHKKKRDSSSSSDDDAPKTLGCVMTQPLGPSLPDFLLAKLNANAEPAAEIGPSLPPPKESAADIGPSLPPPDAESSAKKRRVGPAMPPPTVNLAEAAKLVAAGAFDGLEEEVEKKPAFDDDEFGPRPDGARPHASFFTAEALRRQRLLEEGIKEDDGKTQRREDWMTKLPAEKPKATPDASSRQFSRREVTTRGDSSQWTDSPAERIRKAKEKAAGLAGAPVDEEEDLLSRKAAATASLVKEYNSLLRPHALMEIHDEIVKKEQPAVRDPNALRHFDRDKDLLQRNMKADDVKKFIADSRDLNDRFASSRS